MTKPIVRDPIYRRRRFDAEIIELSVRWYITYRLSYRDLVAMMAERGVSVSHTTIHRCLMHPVAVPLLEAGQPFVSMKRNKASLRSPVPAFALATFSEEAQAQRHCPTDT